MQVLAEKPKEKWSSWMEIKIGCKESRKKISKHISNKNKQESKNNYDVVDLEIAREIRRDLTKTLDELEKKILYEFDAFSLDDIHNSKLTENEVTILEYRIKHHYTYKKISEILDTTQSSVFEIYENAKEKIQKYKRLNNREKKIYKLSNQQKKIFELMEKNKTNRQIAEALDTTIDNVKKQRKKINNKLKGTKLPE